MTYLNKLLKITGIGLIAVSLTSCATSSKLSKVEIPTPVYPPDNLIQDCNIPKKDILTNEDLAIWSKELHDGLLVCNVDKKALREWKKEWKSKEK